MESYGENSSKKMKTVVEEEIVEGDCAGKPETESNVVGSEEIENRIARILEKIEGYTEKFGGLLESGKAKFKELSDNFEAKLILIHREQIMKWQDEIKELRKLDSYNVETSAVLHNARCLLQNPFVE